MSNCDALLHLENLRSHLGFDTDTGLLRVTYVERGIVPLASILLPYTARWYTNLYEFHIFDV